MSTRLCWACSFVGSLVALALAVMWLTATLPVEAKGKVRVMPPMSDQPEAKTILLKAARYPAAKKPVEKVS